MADLTGGTTLGALLGDNQSFEASALDPWSKVSNQASTYLVSSASAVHSSAAGLYAVTGSTGGTARIVACDLATPDAGGALAFPGVGSHAVWSWVWARAADAPSSGQARWRVSGNGDALGKPIAFSAALLRYDVVTGADSPGANLGTGLDRAGAAGAAAFFALDDVLTQIDPLTLHPEWTLEEQSTLLQTQLRSASGRLQTVTWGRYGALSLPLRWLTGQEADVINWWWQLQAPLAFTLDSSNSAAVAVCRITNPRQPIARRIRPYADRWAGTLNLETLDEGSLVF
jgi:hypothetical protein